MMFERIVSLEPSVTATLVALGQRRRLAAITHYCQRLVEVGDLPQLEPTWSVEAGEVAALAPDLVMAGVPYRAGQVDELLKARLNVLCLYPNSLADVYAHITWLGRLCGVPERADAVVRHMQSELAALQAPHLRAGQAQARGRASLRVYVEEWPKPLMNAAPWIAEIVEMLGGTCVPQPPGRQVSQAEVLAADPQVIILNWAGVEVIDPASVAARPSWEGFSAVRDGRVVAVDEIPLNAPGPNLVEGARQVSRILAEASPASE